jgi:hypothetical protein
MITVNVDTSQLEKKLLEKSILMKKSLGTVLRDEGRLLALTLAKYTQPFGLDDKAKGMGESAILKDCTEAFYILPDDLCAKATPIASGQYAGYMQIFAKKTGTVYVTPQANWRIADSTQTLFRYHQGLRNKDGRVRRNRNKIDMNGNVAVINLWVITKGQFAAYLPVIQKEVGFAKSGWVTCARQLGGIRGSSANGSDTPKPWVTRHNAPGRVIDKTTDEKPTITLVNEVNYTSHVLSASGLRGAIAERATKIQLSIDRAVKYGVKDK